MPPTSSEVSLVGPIHQAFGKLYGPAGIGAYRSGDYAKLREILDEAQTIGWETNNVEDGFVAYSERPPGQDFRDNWVIEHVLTAGELMVIGRVAQIHEDVYRNGFGGQYRIRSALPRPIQDCPA